MQSDEEPVVLRLQSPDGVQHWAAILVPSGARVSLGEVMQMPRAGLSELPHKARTFGGDGEEVSPSSAISRLRTPNIWVSTIDGQSRSNSRSTLFLILANFCMQLMKSRNQVKAFCLGGAFCIGVRDLSVTPLPCPRLGCSAKHEEGWACMARWTWPILGAP